MIDALSNNPSIIHPTIQQSCHSFSVSNTSPTLPPSNISDMRVNTLALITALLAIGNSAPTADHSEGKKLAARLQSYCWVKEHWLDTIYRYDIAIDSSQDGGLCGGFFANLNSGDASGRCSVSEIEAMGLYKQSISKFPAYA